MSSAGETDDESRGSSEHPTVTTTAVGRDNGSQRGGDHATESSSSGRSTPVASTSAPWQRATTGGTGGDQTERQEAAGYGTYSDDGYSTADERNAARHPGQGATASQGHPLVSGTAAGRAGGEEATQVQGRSAIDIGAQPAAGERAADGAAQSRGPTPSALRRPGRGPRRASLQLKRFDPWSVLKLALVLCVAMFFVWMVAVGVLYGALDGMGVWDKINGTYNSLAAPQGNTSPLISAGSVFGVAAIIGAINIILFTALATIGAFVYNVSADLVGGLEVTLAERE